MSVFLLPGRPKTKTPLWGQQAEGEAWGLFLGRGSQRRAAFDALEICRHVEG